MKRVLVTAVLDNGDEVDVSVKVNDGDLTISHRDKLQQDVVKKLIPLADDVVHFKIRYNEKYGKSKGKTESLKVSSLAKLDAGITDIFNKIGVK